MAAEYLDGEPAMPRVSTRSRACLATEQGRVVVTCHAPRNAGAGAVMALADSVVALLRGRPFGPLRFETPSVDLDGRDPDGFCVTVVLPIRREAD